MVDYLNGKLGKVDQVVKDLPDTVFTFLEVEDILEVFRPYVELVESLLSIGVISQPSRGWITFGWCTVKESEEIIQLFKLLQEVANEQD